MAQPVIGAPELHNHGTPRERSSLPAPLQAITSKPAQRAYLSAAFFLIIAAILAGVSVVSYWAFYYNFVPQVSFERQVHLQFGDGHPFGIATLGSEPAASQPYDVSVILNLPRTPSNLAAGNFMLDLTLFSPSDGTSNPNRTGATQELAKSRRTGILTYASPMVDTASRLARILFYVFNWKREAEILHIPMMERIEFARGKKNLPGTLKLEIQSHERMQIYSAVVRFNARFTGLRWVMYNWRLLSFMLFSFTFWVVSILVAFAVWMALSAAPESKSRPSVESTNGNTPSVKAESEDGDRTPPGLPQDSAGGEKVTPSPQLKTEDEAIKQEEEIEESTIIEPLIKQSGEGVPGASTQYRFTPGVEDTQGVQRRRTPFSE
ncbi:hypothetical protein VTO42DRAFT_3433 [Malbranchea cinnamomea]